MEKFKELHWHYRENKGQKNVVNYNSNYSIGKTLAKALKIYWQRQSNYIGKGKYQFIKQTTE